MVMCLSANQLLMLVACVATGAIGELFTSMAHMKTALFAERDIAQEIRLHIHQQEERLNALKRVAEKFEQHSETALKNPDEFLGNPVNVYLFVKHFTLDWDHEIEPIIQPDSGQDLKEKIDTLKEYLPNYEDLTGSVSALLRLQDTYKLDTSAIARGDIAGVKSTELSAAECFEIGRQAYMGADFYHTVMWMQEAMDREIAEKNKTVERTDVLDYLTYSTWKQGNVRHALSLTNELLSIEPDHARAASNKAYYEKMIEEEEKYSQKRGDEGVIRNDRNIDEYRKSDEFANYEALCRGETIKVYKHQHKLVCRYRTNSHPLLILQPAKEEEMYLNPWLVVFHNILSDAEMDVIKSLATPKLGRATIQNPRTGKLEYAHYRVSKSAWLKDDDHDVVHRVNRRIQAVTGLTMQTAEELQIANYGIGGHYEPHFDFARKEEKHAFKSLGTGNRIATVLFYMTDVEAGGATVFPYIGVKLFPRKGMAAFWYNLYKNGDGIYNTRHAACPVLVGTKWVSNKWIHERGQEFRRPCGLQENE